MVSLEDLVALRSRKYVLDFAARWDFFVSAYNEAERVKQVFSRIKSVEKFWVVLPEYGYSTEEVAHLSNIIKIAQGSAEDLVATRIVDEIVSSVGLSARILIDITGFMRPHILALVVALKARGISRFDVTYTEPDQYKLKERTEFSGEDVEVVRQVIGFEGSHSDDVDRDLLVIGMGYDDALVSRVANDKDSARLVQLLSLPSLSADMYQESLLRLDRVGMGEGQGSDNDVMFAPANDPFVVAWELARKLREISARGRITNVYLSPLATKVQALGFALYYVGRTDNVPTSVIFPFSRSYSRETSVGVGKSWIYEVEI